MMFINDRKKLYLSKTETHQWEIVPTSEIEVFFAMSGSAVHESRTFVTYNKITGHQSIGAISLLIQWMIIGIVVKTVYKLGE